MIWFEMKRNEMKMKMQMKTYDLIWHDQTKFCSKIFELRTTVQGQSCHHLNHIVSKNNSRVGAIGESNSSGACDFTRENKPRVFPGNAVPGVTEVGSVFPRFRASIWNRQKTRTWRSESRAVDDARRLVDLVWGSCYSGLQPAVTKRIGTAVSQSVGAKKTAKLGRYCFEPGPRR